MLFAFYMFISWASSWMVTNIVEWESERCTAGKQFLNPLNHFQVSIYIHPVLFYPHFHQLPFDSTTQLCTKAIYNGQLNYQPAHLRDLSGNQRIRIHLVTGSMCSLHTESTVVQDEPRSLGLQGSWSTDCVTAVIVWLFYNSWLLLGFSVKGKSMF